MTRENIFIAVLGILFLGNMFGCAVTIHDAAMKGNVDIVNSLLAEDTERINSKDKDGYGRTALVRVLEEGNNKMARLLIEKGADVNIKTKFGQTPLSLASSQGYTEIVELIKKKSNVNKVKR